MLVLEPGAEGFCAPIEKKLLKKLELLSLNEEEAPPVILLKRAEEKGLAEKIQ